MPCPDCGSEEKIIDSGLLYCKKCGLELDELIITTKGKSFRQDTVVPLLDFKIDPRQELYALKFGLKTGRLSKNWESYLGFSVKDNFLKPELKDKALGFIEDSFERNKSLLEASRETYKKQWEKTGSRFFIELENLTNFVIEEDFTCFLSLITEKGMHNSPGNFIIINSALKNANYEIARQLFFIHFRRYIKKFFKEEFDAEDEKLAEVICLFSLLHAKPLSGCFQGMEFSIDLLKDKGLIDIAKNLISIWESRTTFKAFMIDSYAKLGIEKKWISY